MNEWMNEWGETVLGTPDSTLNDAHRHAPKSETSNNRNVQKQAKTK